MASSPIVAQNSSRGTAIVVADSYHVAHGFGMLFGGPAGAVPRDLILEGGLEGESLNGKVQAPVLRTKPCETVVATGVVNAGETAPTLIEILTGMDECEFTRISFRRFVSTVPDEATPANMSGRLYMAPPVNNVWSEAAAIMPEAPLGGLNGVRTKRVEAYEQLRRPVALWYRPVVTGSATMTFEVSVWAMPRWRTNMAKPFAPPLYINGTGEVPPE